jgi:predicted nucleic acid-binding protein
VEVLVVTMHLTPLAQQADQAAVVVVQVLPHTEQAINRQVAVAAWAIEAASALTEPIQAVEVVAQVQLAQTLQVV